MIIEIPSASDFYDAALNQLYLAWQIAIKSVQDLERVEELAIDLDENKKSTASAGYWSKSQPALANALALLKQAMEMALKGRIASISPYLLISREPKDWPAGVDRMPVSFSEFRTLDAADLVKTHNTFANLPLDVHFQSFWNDVRRERNKLMHSVSGRFFEPVFLVRGILNAASVLFSDAPWPRILLRMEAEGKYAAYGLDNDGNQNVVKGQIDLAVSYPTTADSKKFFGFDPKRHSYTCPICWNRANRDWQEHWPHLSQLATKRSGERILKCIVCGKTTEVERKRCINSDCQQTVIFEDVCLSCLWEQDLPYNYPSGLQDNNLPKHFTFDLIFWSNQNSVHADGRFADDVAAIEHARRAMSAPYLQVWTAVTVKKHSPHPREKLLGTWVR